MSELLSGHTFGVVDKGAIHIELNLMLIAMLRKQFPIRVYFMLVLV